MLYICKNLTFSGCENFLTVWQNSHKREEKSDIRKKILKIIFENLKTILAAIPTAPNMLLLDQFYIISVMCAFSKFASPKFWLVNQLAYILHSNLFRRTQNHV